MQIRTKSRCFSRSQLQSIQHTHKQAGKQAGKQADINHLRLPLPFSLFLPLILFTYKQAYHSLALDQHESFVTLRDVATVLAP